MKTDFNNGIFFRFLVLLAMAMLATPVFTQDFSIRGRLHMDAFVGISDADAFVSGFNNRRARMGMSGKINELWDGRIVLPERTFFF